MNSNMVKENNSMASGQTAAQQSLRDQRFNWLRSLRRRRLLVCATLGMLTWFGVAVVVDQPIRAYLFLLCFFIGMWLLRVSIRAIVDLPDQELDERMLTVRNQMFRAAHMTSTALFAALLVSSMIAFDGHLNLKPHEFFGIGFSFFFLMLVLPTAFYAWTEPEI